MECGRPAPYPDQHRASRAHVGREPEEGSELRDLEKGLKAYHIVCDCFIKVKTNGKHAAALGERPLSF